MALCNGSTLTSSDLGSIFPQVRNHKIHTPPPPTPPPYSDAPIKCFLPKCFLEEHPYFMNDFRERSNPHQEAIGEG